MPWSRLPHACAASRWARWAACLILVLVATALLAPRAGAPRPHQDEIERPPAGAQPDHPLGTDDFGRDILSRVIYGARISMLLGLGAVAISTLLATIIGILSGYYGGRIDTVLQRCIDTLMAFPGLRRAPDDHGHAGPGAGQRDPGPGDRGHGRQRADHPERRPGHPREPVSRGGPRHRLPDWQIIARHILPNIAAPIMVVATLGLGVAILAESVAELSRLRRAAPDPVVGRHAQRLGPDLHDPGPVDGGVPRHRHQPGRLRLQHAGRRPPRSPRSQAPRRT